MLKDSSLMGIFPSTPSNTDTATMNMIASFYWDPKGKQIFDSTSLSPHEEMYNVIQIIFDDHTDELHLVASNPYHLPYWLEPSLPILDYLSKTFPSYESIMEIMSTNEPTWEDHHHRSSFLPNTSSVDHDFCIPFFHWYCQHTSNSYIVAEHGVWKKSMQHYSNKSNWHISEAWHPWACSCWAELLSRRIWSI